VADSALAPALRGFLEAVSDEVTAARTDASRAFDVSDGLWLSGQGDEHLYAFRADSVPPVPPETPIRLVIPSRDDVAGVLVALHDFGLVVQLREHVGDTVAWARVLTEPWFILEALRLRLEGQLEREVEDLGLPLALLGLAPIEEASGPAPAAPVDAPPVGTRLDPAQTTAVARCARSRLHFVWGPPGTGKTIALGQLVAALVRAGERVLVLAHANAAVDVAMLRVASALGGGPDLGAGRVLRVGPPQLPDLEASCPEVLPDHLLARTAAAAVGRRRALETQRAEVSRRLRRARTEERARLAETLDATRAQLAGVREALRHALETLMRDARVLGATLSRLAIDDVLWEWPADAVVVDETSMAPFPFVMAAALRARRRLLLFGDFRQLAPIALATTPPAAWWIGRDAFEVAGIPERVARSEPDARVSLLDTQYRMAAPIAAVVSDLGYGGRLRSAPTVRAADALAGVPPWPGAAVVLVDTADLGTVCVREAGVQGGGVAGWSRGNPLQALLALSVARRAAREGGGSVALVTPYRAQARLMAAGAAESAEAPALTAATVHRFQGSERDVVVVDLVDAQPQAGASRLTGRDADAALRLLNVAVSRARGKLVVLADAAFVRTRHPRWSPARALVERLAEEGRVERPDAARAAQIGPAATWFDGWGPALPALARDLERVRADLVLDLPEPVARAVLPVLHALARRGARVTLFARAALGAGAEAGEIAVRPPAHAVGAFALLDRRFAFVGGRGPGAAVARVEGPRVTGALARLLLGDR
jgi:hypothetical protein